VRGQLVHPTVIYLDLSLWSNATSSITRCQFSEALKQIVL